MSNVASSDQPMPATVNAPRSVDLVISDIRNTINGDTTCLCIDLMSRADVGYKKYGVYLQPGNGRDSIIDAYQEVLDCVKYLRTAIHEGRAPGWMRRYYHDMLLMAYDMSACINRNCGENR